MFKRVSNSQTPFKLIFGGEIDPSVPMSMWFVHSGVNPMFLLGEIGFKRWV
jgi:hypothetical protein